MSERENKARRVIKWWGIFPDYRDLSRGVLQDHPWEGGSNMTSDIELVRADELMAAQAENQRLLDRVARLREALKYYATKENWETYLGGESNYAMIKNDQETLPWSAGVGPLYDETYKPTKYVGGKRAREALAADSEGEK